MRASNNLTRFCSSMLTRSFRRTASLIAIASVCAESPLVSQKVVTIGSARRCSDCRIQFQQVAVVGKSGDPVAPMQRSKLAADSRGRIYVAPTYDAGVIAMYDSSGRFLRSFGRAGSGPGEFSAGITQIVVGPDDRIHVFEHSRHTVLAAGLEGVESVGVLSLNPVSALLLPAGGLVVQHLDISGGEDGVVRVVTREGHVVASFDQVDRAEATDPWAAVRVIAHSADGHIWSARVNRYEITEWTVDGRAMRIVRRDASWFRPWSGVEPREPLEKAPRPRITSLYHDARGRLWVLLRVADENWTPRATRGEGARHRREDRSQFYDSVIEVIDIENAVLLAAMRIGDPLTAFVGGGHLIYGARETEAGEVQLSLWRAILVHSAKEELRKPQSHLSCCSRLCSALQH